MRYIGIFQIMEPRNQLKADFETSITFEPLEIFLMRFSLLCSGEWALSFYICVFIYIGVSLKQSTRTLSLGYTEIRKPSPIKTIYKNFRLYRNWKKEECAGARSFFVWFVIGLFETLICAIAEDKVCNSCIVSSWALLIFLLCPWWPNSNFLCCGITQNGESSRDLLLSVTNRKALAPGRHRPPPPLTKHLLHYYQSLSHNSTRNWVLVEEKG